jgi:hypothetical protein
MHTLLVYPKALNLIAKHDYSKSYVVGEAGGVSVYEGKLQIYKCCIL